MVHSANGHRPERAETVGRRRTWTRPRSPFTLLTLERDAGRLEEEASQGGRHDEGNQDDQGGESLWTSPAFAARLRGSSAARGGEW